MPRITIHQIAAEAGVSSATVSRILNGKNQERFPVHARRADRVRRIADKHGYRPNAAARSIRGGRFGVVAMLTCGDLGFDWMPLSLLHGVHSGTEAREMRLLINEIAANRLVGSDFVPRLFRESAVDGFIIHIDHRFMDDVLPAVREQPTPKVFINTKQPSQSIYPDEIEGGRSAVRYLHEQGCRQIGYFHLASAAAVAKPHFSTPDRYAGCLRETRQRGLSTDAMSGAWRSRRDRHVDAMDLAGEYVRRCPGLDAIICYSPSDAVVIHAALRAVHPESAADRVRLLAFGQSKADALVGLPLDTILIPFIEMGKIAVEMVADQCEAVDTRAPSRRVQYRKIIDGQTGRIYAPETGRPTENFA